MGRAQGGRDGLKRCSDFKQQYFQRQSGWSGAEEYDRAWLAPSRTRPNWPVSLSPSFFACVGSLDFGFGRPVSVSHDTGSEKRGKEAPEDAARRKRHRKRKQEATTVAQSELVQEREARL